LHCGRLSQSTPEVKASSPVCASPDLACTGETVALDTVTSSLRYERSEKDRADNCAALSYGTDCDFSMHLSGKWT
jgi:hypothetical protein